MPTPSRGCLVCQPRGAGHDDDCQHWCHGAGAEDWEWDAAELAGIGVMAGDPRGDGERE